MAEAPRRIEIPLTVEHDGETVEIGRLCYVREDVAERENAELRELVRDLYGLAWPECPGAAEAYLPRIQSLGVEVD